MYNMTGYVFMRKSSKCKKKAYIKTLFECDGSSTFRI